MVGVDRLAWVTLLMIASGAVAAMAEGLVVDSVIRRSRAEEAGIQPGDLPLELDQRTAPESLLSGYLYYLLGRTAFSERDLDTADSYFRRALAVQEKLAPGSWEVARSLHGLGTTAMERRQPRRAGPSTSRSAPWRFAAGSQRCLLPPATRSCAPSAC